MDEVLQFAIENGIINISYIQDKYEMNKRKELLEKHQWAISQGKDGYWRTYLPNEEKGRRMIKKTTRKAVEDEVVFYWQEQLENPTIKEVFEEWNNRRVDLKKISEATHLRNTQIFNRHYKEFGKKRIKNVEEEEISEFLEEQIPLYNLTSKAFSNLKTITRGFLKRAKKRKLISWNVEEMFQELDTSESDFKKVVKEDYEEVFSEEETDRIIPYLISHRDRQNLGILLMFATGIRVGELAVLKKEDVLDNYLNIHRTETKFQRNGKFIYAVKDFPKTEAGVRNVVVPSGYQWLIREIRKIDPESEFIFVNSQGDRMTTNCFRNRIKKICKLLEIPPKSPHKVRKTYGSILLDNHVDNKLIMGQMGHTDILCTENYYHRNRRSLESKEKILSAIPEFNITGDLITK